MIPRARVAVGATLALVVAAALAGCATASTEPGTPPPSSAHRAYGQAELDYFAEIAIGSEYGTQSTDVRKWVDPIRIEIHGDPTAEDLATVDDVVADLNDLMASTEVSVVDTSANLDVYFAPLERFPGLDPNYVRGNLGFFSVEPGPDGAIASARVLVSTTGLTQEERDHIIREEITGSLGLMRDSWDYPESIFYQGWTHTRSYSALDEAIVEMLYLPQIEPGMTADEALAVLRSQ